MFKPILGFLFTGLLSMNLFGQENDLLKGIADTSRAREYVTGAFKSTRVIMSQSTEMLKPGVLDFRILHRFGNVNQGISEFFGLDDATIRLGLDYGITKNLTVGIGRGSFHKEVDGFLKYRAIQQATGASTIPISLLFVGGITMIGESWSNRIPKPEFKHRLGYYFQAVLGRKFSDLLTLQVNPTYLHRNLVPSTEDPNNVFATGIAGRLKLSKRISLNVDYYYVFNQPESYDFHNPLSIGFDIETGGHVFQLHFTNAAGMNEKVFLTETFNDWLDGDIQFGFNISRSFQLGKKKK
ncbi:MAG: hypothetical protein EOO04_24075 [Chitinophagaceae bacterium]|nr:MAG: hypothetical protein EOO04_24075 [Chitinophagaceae bacterium]